MLYNSGEFSYDGAGNVSAMGADTFVYDGVSRLVSGSVSQGASSQDNAYDAFGNRASVDTNGVPCSIPTDPATNRLLDQPEGAVAYDAAGNLTLWGPATYVYDALNMPIQQTGLGGRTYLYTADDRRIATFRNGGSQDSTWTVRDLDGKVLRIFSDDGIGSWSWEKDYIYHHSRLLASHSAGNGTWNYHLDHLGTIRLITYVPPRTAPTRSSAGTITTPSAKRPFPPTTARPCASPGTSGTRSAPRSSRAPSIWITCWRGGIRHGWGSSCRRTRSSVSTLCSFPRPGTEIPMC